MSQTFDWVQLPGGRARFSGTFRCWDEQGRKTFALELRGREYFGEIKRSYLQNHSDYNIVVDAFGYGQGGDVAMPGPGTRETFTPDEEAVARAMVVALVHAGLKFIDPPTILDETEDSHFMGEIIFQDGWILVRSDHDGVPQ